MCPSDIVFRSIGAQYLSSPVSLRNFFARRTRSTGLHRQTVSMLPGNETRKPAHTKVSGRVSRVRIKRNPAKHVNSQKTHRHDTPATLIHPLTVGPREGPAKGARVKRASALPRVSASQMSEITALYRIGYWSATLSGFSSHCTYPLFARGAAANVPPRKRKTSNAPVLGANAHPTCIPV